MVIDKDFMSPNGSEVKWEGDFLSSGSVSQVSSADWVVVGTLLLGRFSVKEKVH